MLQPSCRRPWIALASPSLAGAAAVVLLASRSPGQATFRGLNTILSGGFTSARVEGVSANGAYLVGWGHRAGGSDAFRWSAAQGMVALTGLPGAGASARGVSANGAVVAGDWASPARSAFRWSWPAGAAALGGTAWGYAVSANGQAIVGRAGTGTTAFRWTAGSGVVPLGDLAGGAVQSIAYAVSADGAVVVGESASGLAAREAFRWTHAGGMAGLGLLPGRLNSVAHAVSADGTTVVGNGFSEGFRWTAATGMTSLGKLPGEFGSPAADVNADGRIVVGGRDGAPGERILPFLWMPETGIVNLAQLLQTQYSLNVTDSQLGTVIAMSDDGRVIVGRSAQQSWMVTLPAAPCGTPAAPTGVAASDGTICGLVRIAWTGNPAHVGHYEIWRGPTQTGAGSTMIATDTASPYFDATAGVGNIYWYFVRAKNSCGRAGPFAAGNSGWHGPLAAPTGVVASDGTICGYTRVAWNAVPGAASYTIWRTPAHNPGDPEQVGTDTASPFFDQPATRTQFIYSVRAVGACGAGPLSLGDAGHVSPHDIPPGRVAASDAAHPTYVRVSWEPFISGTYSIWRSSLFDPEGAAAVKVGTANAPPFFDAPPTSNEYWYFVKTHVPCGTSILSVGNKGRRQ